MVFPALGPNSRTNRARICGDFASPLPPAYSQLLRGRTRMALPLATHPYPYLRPFRRTPDHVIEQLKAALAVDDMVTFRELLAANPP